MQQWIGNPIVDWINQTQRLQNRKIYLQAFQNFLCLINLFKHNYFFNLRLQNVCFCLAFLHGIDTKQLLSKAQLIVFLEMSIIKAHPLSKMHNIMVVLHRNLNKHFMIYFFRIVKKEEFNMLESDEKTYLKINMNMCIITVKI